MEKKKVVKETKVVKEDIKETKEVVKKAIKGVKKNPLIGEKWELTKHTIVSVVSETDTAYLVAVSDGCTYHLLK